MGQFLSRANEKPLQTHNTAFERGNNTNIQGEAQNRHPIGEQVAPGDRKREQILEEVGKRIIQQSVHAVNPSVGKANQFHGWTDLLRKILIQRKPLSGFPGFFIFPHVQELL
jgi:hypothetical protein